MSESKQNGEEPFAKTLGGMAGAVRGGSVGLLIGGLVGGPIGAAVGFFAGSIFTGKAVRDSFESDDNRRDVSK